MKICNVFFIHTIFQKDIADSIIENDLSYYNQINIAIINKEGDMSINLESEKWTNIHILTPSIGNSWTGLTPIHCKIVCNKIINNYDEHKIYLHMSNINHPLANTFSKYIDNEFIYYIQYPEGWANLVSIKNKHNHFFKSLLKYFYGLLQCNPYNFIGFDYGAPHLASKMLSYNHIFKLYKKSQATLHSNRVFIIGHLIKSNIIYNNYISTLKSILYNNPKFKFFYKPHPRDENFLDELIGIENLKVLESEQSAESLVFEYRCKKVLGFTSSSLINLKMMDNNSFEIYSINPINFHDKGSGRRSEILKHLYSHGVTDLKPNYCL